MEANEAPEKLYLINDVDAVMLSYDPPTKLQGNRYDFVDKEVFPIEEGCEVEYTRTDAFIEKAEKYLKTQFIKDVSVLAGGVVNINFSTAIKNFVNYIKGE